jgi:hypothetical protein
MARQVRIKITGTTVLIAICSLILVLTDQRRTDGELTEILSAYLSDGILHDAHDWGPGHRILLVIQSEPERPGNMRSGWLSPFDSRLKFRDSSPITRISFLLSNAISRPLRIAPHLPRGVRSVIAGRDYLESKIPTPDFQKQFPNNLGYIAVSRAGFNFSKTEAIFYIDHFCGLCGGGRYVLMRKVNGIWQAADEHYTWIS